MFGYVVIVLIAVGLSICTWFYQSSAIIRNSTNLSDYHLYAGCKILSYDFKIVRTLGSEWLCLPLPDGSWIASNSATHLRRYDPMGEIIWEKKGYFHHQISKDDEDSFITLGKTEKTVGNEKVMFEEVYRMSIAEGTVLGHFSTYDELKEHPELLKRMDLQVNKTTRILPSFSTDLEKLHLNSLSRFEEEYIVNNVVIATFILNKNFKFKRFVDFPEKLNRSRQSQFHDIQQIGKNRYLVFNNNYQVSDGLNSLKKTFKIYEIDNNEIVFEFPLAPQDYVTANYSGGVQKFGDNYIVGFPGTEESNQSTVGIISKNGQWIKKLIVPYRFQDVRILPYKNFLNLNKAK